MYFMLENFNKEFSLVQLLLSRLNWYICKHTRRHKSTVSIWSLIDAGWTSASKFFDEFLTRSVVLNLLPHRPGGRVSLWAGSSHRWARLDHGAQHHPAPCARTSPTPPRIKPWDSDCPYLVPSASTAKFLTHGKPHRLDDSATGQRLSTSVLVKPYKTIQL